MEFHQVPDRSQPPAILDFVVADKIESDPVVSLRFPVQLREAPVGAIFGKEPIKRAERCDYRPLQCARFRGITALARRRGARYFRLAPPPLVIQPKRLFLDRQPSLHATAALERLAKDVRADRGGFIALAHILLDVVVGVGGALAGRRRHQFERVVPTNNDRRRGGAPHAFDFGAGPRVVYRLAVEAVMTSPLLLPAVTCRAIGPLLMTNAAAVFSAPMASAMRA